MNDPILESAIAAELGRLEADSEIVVCTTSPLRLAKRLHDAVRGVVPDTGLTQQELLAVRSLIFHAVNTPSFFDWEMPTLTGATAEEFRAIADKLPRG
jgi:hypothetical protein